MKIKSFALMGFLGVLLIVDIRSAKAESLSVYGRIVLISKGSERSINQQPTQAQTSVTVFTIKLYFPKEVDRPVLLTYPDPGGSFSFTNLAKGSYLLEVSLGSRTLYQKIVNLESTILLAVPIGDLKLIEEATVGQRATATLNSAEFQTKVKITVGNIKRAMEPDRGPFSLTIQASTKSFRYTLTPPAIVAFFSYGNQNFVLTGTVRTSSHIDLIDCEVYRR